MKTYISFFIVLLIFCGQHVLSQNIEYNLDRYWYYRERLERDFLVQINNHDFPPWGSFNGTNIPVVSMSPLNSGTLDIPFPNSIRWSDAMEHMGYYIAVLATEYKLTGVCT